MKNLISIAIVLSAAVAASGQAAGVKIDDLAWLAGCWESNNAEKKLLISEQWMRPAGGMMIGSGRTVRDGRAVDFEFIRIVEEGDGLFFIAKPKANKDETRFKLISSSPSAATFENPTHDFPQRVIYRRDGERLTGRIEGSQNGKIRGVDFPMVRAKCD